MPQHEKDRQIIWRVMLVGGGIAAVMLLGFNCYESARTMGWVNEGGRQRWRTEQIVSAIREQDKESLEAKVAVWREVADMLHDDDPHCGICSTVDRLRVRIDKVLDESLTEAKRIEIARDVGLTMDTVVSRVCRMGQERLIGPRYWMAATCQVLFSVAAIAHARRCECRSSH